MALMLDETQCAILVEALEIYEVWEYNAAQAKAFPELREEVSRIMKMFPAIVPLTQDASPKKTQEVGDQVVRMFFDSEDAKPRTTVCTYPCSEPVNCVCTNKKRTVRKVVKRRSKP